jgi:hypothetical protein
MQLKAALDEVDEPRPTRSVGPEQPTIDERRERFARLARRARQVVEALVGHETLITRVPRCVALEREPHDNRIRAAELDGAAPFVAAYKLLFYDEHGPRSFLLLAAWRRARSRLIAPTAGASMSPESLDSMSARVPACKSNSAP